MRWTAIAVALAGCARIGGGGGGDDQPARITVGAGTLGAAQLPAWFGSRSAAQVRVAGQVWDDEVPARATVHLRLAAAADPTVWLGLDRETRADGSFDFGLQRAGDYVVIATAPGKQSRAVATRGDDDLAVYAYRCTDVAREVLASGHPVEGARVDIAGVVVATTDAKGHFTVCAGDEPIAATVRAPGYAATRATIDRTGGTTRPIALALGGEIGGDVWEKNGKPAIGLGVQAVAVRGADVLPVVGTSDAFGRFTLHDVPRGASVNFQFVDGAACLTDRTTVGVAVSAGDAVDRELAHAQLAYAHDERTVPATAATVRGRIVHAGRGLGDARIAIGDAATRSRPDGTFALPVAAAGSAVLAVDHPRGLATARAVAAAEDTELVIDLADTGTIAGTLVDAGGHPLRGTIHLVARDTAVERTLAVTNGHFTFAAIELGGTYTLDATAEARRAAVEVTLDDSLPNVTGLELTLH